MLADATEQIRIYPKISAAAIRDGYSAAMRLYDLAQALAAANSGRAFFSRKQLIDLNFLSKFQIDRALRDGLNRFWIRTAQGDYKLIARAKVAAWLGITNPGAAVAVSADTFSGNLAQYKAAIYAAWLGQSKEPTYSRATLQDTFGASVPTLLEYERTMDVTARPRYVFSDFPRGVAVTDELNHYTTDRVWISVVSKRGKVLAGRRLLDNGNIPLDDFWRVQDEPPFENDAECRLTWQVTNEYQSPLDRAASGRGSWLRSDIRKLDITPDANGMGGQTSKRIPQAQRRDNWNDLTAYQSKFTDRPAILEQRQKWKVFGEFVPSIDARLKDLN